MADPANPDARDIDAFARMLTRARQRFTTTDYGGTGCRSVTFTIAAGIAGSTSTLAEAFFDRVTGEFRGIHHCD